MVAFWRQGGSSQQHLVDLKCPTRARWVVPTLCILKHPRWEKLRGSHGNEMLRSGNEEVRHRRRIVQNAVCPHSGNGFLPSTTRFLGSTGDHGACRIRARTSVAGTVSTAAPCPVLRVSCPLSCLESSGLLSGALLVLPTSVFLGTRQKIAFECFLHFLVEYSGPEGQSWWVC